MQTLDSLIEFVKSLFRDGWAFTKNSNFYLTLITLLTAVAPKAGEILEAIGIDKLVEAIGTGDPQVVFVAVLATLNTVYHLFLKDRALAWLKAIIDSLYKTEDKTEEK